MEFAVVCFETVINEANVSSSACYLQVQSPVETSAPPDNVVTLTFSPRAVKPRAYFCRVVFKRGLLRAIKRGLDCANKRGLKV